MNLSNLEVPIIVYWDISPVIDINQQIIHSICADLVKNEIFILYIWDSSYSLSTTSYRILKKLKNEQINVILTVPYSSLGGFDVKQFVPALEKIFIHYESLDKLVIDFVKIQSYEGKIVPAGIAFSVNENNFRDIPGVLILCLKSGIKDIHFPIQRPKPDRLIFYPDDEIIRWLSNEIEDIKTDDLNINVHDPFLWTVFNKRVTENTKGCQGANTMIYISDDLNTTPCPLLPIVFGNLQKTTLTEVFLSDMRKEIRMRLSKPPNECVNCVKLNNCLGGCRGRAYMIYQTFDKKDPACHY